MANWAWEVIYPINKDYLSEADGRFAVVGNRLWMSLGRAGANRIFYTDDGVTWHEEDMTAIWTDTSTWPVPICGLGGSLYAARNYPDPVFTSYSGGFDLWKRNGPSDWTKVATTPETRVLAHGIDAASTHLMICGSDWQYFSVPEGDAYVWRFDIGGASLVEEYHSQAPALYTEPYERIGSTSKESNVRYPRGIYYYPATSTWYFSCHYKSTPDYSRVRRRTGPSAWIVDHDEAGLHYVGEFDRTRLGLACRRLRYISEQWQQYTGNADKFLPFGWEEGGHTLLVKQTWPENHIVMWTPGWTWETTGDLIFDPAGNDRHIIDDIAHFNGRLFLAADKNLGQNPITLNIIPTYTYRIISVPLNYFFGTPFDGGDAEDLVCEHEFGTTIYLGLRDEDKHPMILWLDWDFENFWLGYHSSAGSAIGVQSVEDGAECFGFGYFDTDKQIIVSTDYLETWDEAQGEFGDDVVTSLEFHETNGNDLAGTRRLNQDLIQTLTQRKPWTGVGPTPFVARCQLRVGDDIFIGSDVANAQPVRVFSSSSGSWTDKSSGLPTDVAINDLELGF